MKWNKYIDYCNQLAGKVKKSGMIIDCIRNTGKNKKVEILSPFFKYTKSQIVEWYKDKNLSLIDLKNTVSCYSNIGTLKCGKCSSCFRRWIAMEKSGIHEDYLNKIEKWKKIPEYIKKMKIKGHYDEQRIGDTFLILKKYGFQV